MRTARIELHLRTPHVHYLEYLAEHLGISLSGAFGFIVEKHAAVAMASSKPPRKNSKELSIEPEHADILNRLAVRQGLRKSDVARRMIERAMAQDEVVGG